SLCGGRVKSKTAVSQSTSCVVVAKLGLRHSCLKSKGSVSSIPTRSRCFATTLYIDVMRASMLAKYVSGAGSPIARRCAFVGHLRNAANVAAVIELFIIGRFAAFSADTIRNQWRDQVQSKVRQHQGRRPVADQDCSSPPESILPRL